MTRFYRLAVCLALLLTTLLGTACSNSASTPTPPIATQQFFLGLTPDQVEAGNGLPRRREGTDVFGHFSGVYFYDLSDATIEVVFENNRVVKSVARIHSSGPDSMRVDVNHYRTVLGEPTTEDDARVEWHQSKFDLIIEGAGGIFTVTATP